jgi:hypothetical protein
MKTQWQVYKKLELIPDTVSYPHSFAVGKYLTQLRQKPQVEPQRSPLSPLNKFACIAWRQNVDHLEQCLAISNFDNQPNRNLWQGFLGFVDQVLENWQIIAVAPEPTVSQTMNAAGDLLWQVHDPRTGKTIDLESVEAVQVWLDERYHL